MTDFVDLPAALVIEKDRQAIYDAIQDAFETDGIDLKLFFSNLSYFGEDENGQPVPWIGGHPTLIHWPLGDYQGGKPLLEVLWRETQTLENIAGPERIVWVRRPNWHSTVFSPVHSTDPQVIARVPTDFAEIARSELLEATPYALSFTRIVITHDAGIKAVGYAHNQQLNSLRLRLKQSMPRGHGSAMIHISLGNFVKPLEAGALKELKEYTRRYQSDQVFLGQIAVRFLTYAQYTGPFTEMTVREIFRQPLGERKNIVQSEQGSR